MGRIGIFGGTFNPIHKGHLLAISEFQRLLALDTVLVIPAAVPPHKSLPARSPDGALRLAMVQAATAHLPYVTVSDLEMQRPGLSYTSDTLAQIAKEHPEDTLFFLMGSDSFLAFSHWHCPQEICRLATLVCFHREKDDMEQLLRQKQELEQQYQARIQILENQFLAMSSSTVRRMAFFGCAKDYVSQPVLDILQQHGLYGIGASWEHLPMDELQEVSLSLTKAKRVPHVIGCAQTAMELAKRFGADPILAGRAGILHDVTKALDGQEQLRLCDHFAMQLSDFERRNPKLLHAKTGAAVAHYIFGEADIVCDAIYWHTTGKANMTTMEKILYIADYMEPNRDFPGVEILRQQVQTDLDAAMLTGLEMTLTLLRQQGKEIDPDSRAARDYLYQERNKP